MKNHVHPRPARRHAAFSLIEMVLSLTVLSIVFAAVGSVFVLAAKVIPAPGSVLAAGVEQSKALTRVVEDIQAARYVTESTANSVTIVVDDRTGDGLPDRLRYAWSGTAGDPLTLSINGSTPATVAEGVEAFTLGFTTEDRVDTVAGGDAAAGGESLLYTYNTAASGEVRDLADQDDKVGIGQLVSPTLPADVSSYTVTRIRVSARNRGPANGETYVRLYDADGTLPTGAALAEEILLESSLPAAFEWVDVPFASPVTRLVGDPFAVALEWKTDQHSAGIEFDAGGGDGFLTQNNDTDPWVITGGKNLLIEVYGTCDCVSPDITMTRQVRTHAQVTLQVGDSTSQEVTTRLYREPGVHSAVWDAGFEASSVGVDLDGDGADWSAQSGGAPGSFSNGRWQVDGLLFSQAVHTFAEPMVVDLVMGATGSSRGGAVFQINADQTVGQAVPIIVRAGRDTEGAHYIQVFDNEAQGTPRLQVEGLGTNLPRVRLLIAPADDAVGLIVNGAPAGAFTYAPVSAGGIPGYATLSEASDGVFDEVSIRVGAAAVVTQAGSP